MRIPEALASLAEHGIIEQVLRPLMSGKEAQVYLVRAEGQYRVAKVYKEAKDRSFKHRAEYTEGRKVRNTRDQRAIGKGTRHGRAQTEAAWRSTEVDMIYRLRDAGVRVPQPFHFIDGVLVMEMITDEHGDPAPRLGDVVLPPEEAEAVFGRLLAEVVRMLAAGVVHGDLSDFNVLMGMDGPVIIDFPQAVDASSNQNARKLLLRDVDNLHRYAARFAPGRRTLPYAQEMWALYERGLLTSDTKLSGRFQAADVKVSTDAVMGLIGDATRDERRRREHLGLSMRGAGELPSRAADPGAETTPRPLSRYAQKREAAVAARRLEAASKPVVPQPRTQHDARGRTHEPGPRSRGADPRSRSADPRDGSKRPAHPHATQPHTARPNPTQPRPTHAGTPAPHASAARPHAARSQTEAARAAPPHAARPPQPRSDASAPRTPHVQANAPRPEGVTKRRRRRNKRRAGVPGDPGTSERGERRS